MQISIPLCWKYCSHTYGIWQSITSPKLVHDIGPDSRWKWKWFPNGAGSWRNTRDKQWACTTEARREREREELRRSWARSWIYKSSADSTWACMHHSTPPRWMTSFSMHVALKDHKCCRSHTRFGSTYSTSRTTSSSLNVVSIHV
jgi:hypothetical protein